MINPENESDQSINDRKVYMFDHLYRWLKDGATIKAIDTNKVLEFLPDGAIYGGLEIVFPDERRSSL